MNEVSESTKIWREKHEIEMARINKQRELMAEYDKTIYYPAMKSLRERCAAIGHIPQSTVHDNGLGYFWKHCNQCGARLDLTVCPDPYIHG